MEDSNVELAHQVITGHDSLMKYLISLLGACAGHDLVLPNYRFVGCFA